MNVVLNIDDAKTRSARQAEAEATPAAQRLALTRVLIWAEREASAQERPAVAQRLREAIVALHREG